MGRELFLCPDLLFFKFVLKDIIIIQQLRVTYADNQESIYTEESPPPLPKVDN